MLPRSLNLAIAMAALAGSALRAQDTVKSGEPVGTLRFTDIRYLPRTLDDFGKRKAYVLAFVNNLAFPHEKVLDVYWAGLKYTVLPGLDLTGAYYGYHQNSYGAGASAGCSTNAFSTCSGSLESFSLDAVYAFTKRFDGYVGAMYSGVHDGVANGYLYQRTNINPTIGVRFKF